ncbi:hypothetical protein LJK88_39580 [Paenibacillus sp. P26]|nr:hypothetical protein LJK88_39580 [Paenibacillus sp. P26]
MDLSDQSKVIATKIKAQPSGMDWDGNLVFDLLLSGKDVVITSNMYIQIINLEDLRVKFRSTNIDQLGIKFPQLTQQKIQDAEDKSLFEKVKIKSAASKTMDFMIYYQPVYTPDPSSGSLKLVGMIQIGMQLDQTERLFSCCAGCLQGWPCSSSPWRLPSAGLSRAKLSTRSNR